MKHLFIGGPADGQLIETTDRVYSWRIPERTQSSLAPCMDTGVPVLHDVRVVDYKRVELFDGSNARFTVYVTSGVYSMGVIKYLLNSYLVHAQGGKK